QLTILCRRESINGACGRRDAALAADRRSCPEGVGAGAAGAASAGAQERAHVRGHTEAHFLTVVSITSASLAVILIGSIPSTFIRTSTPSVSPVLVLLPALISVFTPSPLSSFSSATASPAIFRRRVLLGQGGLISMCKLWRSLSAMV